MSIAHEHLLAVLADNINGPCRILDVGCFSGAMVGYLQENLPDCEVYGMDFDVWPGMEDHLRRARADLAKRLPVDWNERIKLYEGENPFGVQFDFILTNQVFEHVHALSHMMAVIESMLAPGGMSINLFPLKNVIWEDHCKAPFAHRLPEPARKKFLGAYGKITGKPADWPDIWTRKLTDEVSYRTIPEIVSLAEESGLKPDFSYTLGFYLLKLCKMTGIRNAPVPRASIVWLLKYISGVTLILRRQ